MVACYNYVSMKSRPIKTSTLFRKLGQFVSVRNMDSVGSYGQVENQFILNFKNGDVFQSYGATVAAYVNGQLYVNEYYHDYSRTTMKYCKQYTGRSVDERRRLIQKGVIKTFI